MDRSPDLQGEHPIWERLPRMDLALFSNLLTEFLMIHERIMTAPSKKMTIQVLDNAILADPRMFQFKKNNSRLLIQNPSVFHEATFPKCSQASLETWGLEMRIGYPEGHIGTVLVLSRWASCIYWSHTPQTNLASPMKVWKMMFLLRLSECSSFPLNHGFEM